MIESLGIKDDQSIRSKALTRSVETAQKKVEGNNFDMRKNLLDYDNVMNQQRDIIYTRRNEILDEENIHDRVLDTFKEAIEGLVDAHIEPEGYITEEDKSEIVEYVNSNYLKRSNLSFDSVKELKDEELIDYIYDLLIKDYNEKIKDAPRFDEFEKAISLRIIDNLWVDHITAMEHLKEAIMLRGYAQVNPLQAYTIEGYELFDELENKINNTGYKTRAGVVEAARFLTLNLPYKINYFYENGRGT